MRPYRVLSVLVVIAMLLTACTTAAPSTTAPSAPTTAAPPATAYTLPERPPVAEGFMEGELNPMPVMSAPDPANMAEEQVVTWLDTSPSSPNTWDPIRNPGGQTRYWLRNLWLSLLRADMNWNILPGLAIGWDYSPDFTTYIFYLDPEAVWSDGTPFKAQDVLDIWNSYAVTGTLAGSPWRTDIAGRIKGYDEVFAGTATEMEGLIAVDDHTLRIELKEPDPTYKYKLTWWAGAIPPADQFNADPELWTTKPGVKFTGPYMIGSFDAVTGEATLVPNPMWWRNKPILTEMRFKVVEDTNTQLIMIENKEAEFGSMPADAWPSLEERGIIKPVQAGVYPSFYYFWIRTDKEPTDDIHVRRALIHAIDLNTAFEAAMNPVHPGWMVMNGWIPFTVECSRQPEGLTGHEFDPELAKAEAAQSSYGAIENWPKIRMQAGSSSAWEATRMAEVLLEMWKTNLGLTNVEYKMNTQLFPEPDQELINVIRTSEGVLIPDAGAWMVTNFTKGSWYDTALAYYNPEVESLVLEANSLQRDDPRYCELLQQSEDLFWADFTVIGIMSNTDQVAARVTAWVENLTYSIDIDWYTMDQMWISKK